MEYSWKLLAVELNYWLFGYQQMASAGAYFGKFKLMK